MADATVPRRSAASRDRRERFLKPQRHRPLGRAARRALPLADHGGEDSSEMDRGKRDRVATSGLPVLMQAARHACSAGVEVIAGAPNVVCGAGLSGDLAAAAPIRDCAADALASDHVPGTVAEAAWRCVAQTGQCSPVAPARVTDAPTRLRDHGRFAPVPRSDLARVRGRGDRSVVRRVRRVGGRVS